MLPAQYQAFYDQLTAHIDPARLITDPTRTLAYGTDASFYRLVPKIVAQVNSESEIAALLALAHQHRVAVTFRAAGTSLSGQAVTDSVLVTLGAGWTGQEVLDGGARIRLQPGVIGQHANNTLARWAAKSAPIRPRSPPRALAAWRPIILRACAAAPRKTATTRCRRCG
ncbi:MAG: FAD-binding protein [Rivihabitans pingtungensis]